MKRLWRAKGIKPADVVITVVTEAGEVAQVDFGYVGLLRDSALQVLRKAWVFVMGPSHSRHQSARVVFDQRSETWLRLHAQAFGFFGCVPATVIPDNLKAAEVRCAFGFAKEPGLHRSYVELERFYWFKVDPAPPIDPQWKSKAESGMKYALRGQLAESPAATVALQLEPAHQIAAQIDAGV